MEKTAKRNIRAEVRKKGVILYSNEVPKIGVYTYRKENKTERQIIRNSDKVKRFNGIDNFYKTMIFIFLIILEIIIWFSNIDLKHRIYLICILNTTGLSSILIARQIYDAHKNKEITMKKTAISKLLNAYEKSDDIPTLDKIKKAKPYANGENFIKELKLGTYSLICFSVLIPNICMVHPIMSFTFGIIIFLITSTIAYADMGDRIFAPLQYLITKEPYDDKYYAEAIEALKNYVELSEKIGVTYDDFLDKAIEKLKADEEEKASKVTIK